jgi:hypothetical protein
MKPYIAFLLLLCATPAYSMNIFRCMNDDQRVLYTDIDMSGEWKCAADGSPSAEGKQNFLCIGKGGSQRHAKDDHTGSWRCHGLLDPRPRARGIERGSLTIGMSKSDVIKKWGDPIRRLSRTQTRSGITEELAYPGAVLTFMNGTLEVIRN